MQMWVNGEEIATQADERTVLDLLQRVQPGFLAPCGGAGTCGKCRVELSADEQPGYEALACRTELKPGLHIVTPDRGAMSVAGADTSEAGESSELEGITLSAAAAWDGHSPIGAAIDLGTTTIACAITELETGRTLASAAAANPQGAFGADVISRISASVEGKLDAMAECVRSVLSRMISACCQQLGVERQQLAGISIAGNTVMEHILAGLAPDSIGVAPYEPQDLFGHEVELPCIGHAFLAPCVSGYVGGDITAGLLATRLHQAPKLQVFMDLGTNGELAIGSAAGILACATAAGPVFEGAGIACGMPAQPGAVNVARLNAAGEVECETVGGKPAVGLCGSGLIDAIALLLELGVVDDSGRMLELDELHQAWRGRMAQRDGYAAFMLVPEANVYVNQADVRNVQLAKAAICAGVQTLMEKGGFTCADVETLLLAGGFGLYLNPESAARIGLFPPELRDKAKAAGNTSLAGAALMLQPEAAAEAQQIASSCDYTELSTDMSFTTHYIEQMAFPTP